MKIVTDPGSSPRSAAEAVRRPLVGALLVVSLVLLSGCGNTLYLVRVSEAEEEFKEAEELGAEKYAPFEYYSAKERLKEAKVQAAQAEYGNASTLSLESTDYSREAAEKTTLARAAARMATSEADETDEEAEE